ncbi:NADH-quinone oxidoreductase subunit J [Parachitinimonas caeni]|uniref:NADH-quinone oxidoreductase subunit J n=1 Tax=Parachitinimonas caeni TaxID=3031301 RepID=A0ABT7E0D2_9NEIS|nr:NADH-quinone oxidoreductase subunit J [Parachitinimonas caeni]MDK2124808.1 NADH-quinone oxidoreductase subunit J [Parachitinimonas caeni]
MNWTLLIFYLVSAVLLVSSILVVTVRNSVYAALALMLSFFSASIVWIMIEAEFLAISLVLVYVGAVMVLFLFVVMMLDINFERIRQGFWKYSPAALGVGVLMVLELSAVLLSRKADFDKLVGPKPIQAGSSNIEQLGLQVYSNYILPLELAAVVLLVAIVAAISLTLRKKKLSKYVDPAKQIAIRREDRVRLVKGRSS